MDPPGQLLDSERRAGVRSARASRNGDAHLIPASRAAAQFGISSRTVANWTARGGCPRRRGPWTARLVDPAQLEALAAERLPGERSAPRPPVHPRPRWLR